VSSLSRHRVPAGAAGRVRATGGRVVSEFIGGGVCVKKPSSASTNNKKTASDKLKEIETHSYYRTLIEKALVPIVQAKKEADGEKRAFSPTPIQQYNIDVFYRSASLFEAVKRLYDISYFIMNNPQFKSMANHGVTPEDWFVYHYSNYRVIATGIYDTALIVVNFLLRIDLPAKECNNSTIRRHLKVREKKIDIPLKGLDKVLRECFVSHVATNFSIRRTLAM
jgi:hypothetical protein